MVCKVKQAMGLGADKVIWMHVEIFCFLHLFKVNNECMILLQGKGTRKTINNRL